jgi:Na+/H+ antiporter NhaD/arsenite permease-like protein
MELIDFNVVFWLTLIIFAVTYIIIISEKIHPTVTAMSGALLLVLLGIINQEEAIAGVDFNTLGLLIGMMVIVGISKHCGIFQYVAIMASKIGKGKPLSIFIILGFITAIFSAFLDNVTTVLLMVPVMFVVANNLKVKPMPYLISTILLSNIGGAATLIGDPPNILIGSAAELDFNDFLFNLGPIALISTITVTVMLAWWYKKEFVCSTEAQAAIMGFKPAEAITDKSLLVKSLFVLFLVLVGFFTHSATGLEGATIALAGAALLLLLTLNEPEHHLKEVEWTTIFFFIGLFILVTGLEKAGLINLMAEQLLSATGGNQISMTISVLWGSAVLSSVVNNIPFVATMIPLIKEIGEISNINLEPIWWALAIGTDFGGNATIVGASANVIVAEIAHREGYHIDFFKYIRIALPATIFTLILGTIYIYFRYLI